MLSYAGEELISNIEWLNDKESVSVSSHVSNDIDHPNSVFPYSYFERDNLEDATKTENYYDKFGRIEKVLQELPNFPAKTENLYEYQSFKTTITQKDLVNQSTEYNPDISKEIFYNELGEIIKVKDTGGDIIEYTYNSLGKPESIEVNDRTITYNYDTRGRLSSVIDPALGQNSYQYNSITNLLESTTDYKGYTTNYQYDDLLRVDALTTNQGQFQLQFDGQFKSSIDEISIGENQLIEYEYDDLKRPEVLTEIYKEDTTTIGFEYSPVGKTKSLTINNKHTLETQYFDNGQAKALLLNGTILAESKHYSPSGKTRILEYGNGVQVEHYADYQKYGPDVKYDELKHIDDQSEKFHFYEKLTA